MKTSRDVAVYMVNKLMSERKLYQEYVVYEIQKEFGDQFVYENENGNLAIDKIVLKNFRELTKDTVVWVRDERYWRLREKGDEPAKRQVDY